ncbi:hypothetical protein PLESTB_001014800 [Pleodorina starrii]|uniref:Uncharacterized protein n=1 Tax=Pleodorina starrii TaxID=330485 RepID=A0A9W6BPD5_9CHLO|nr:hypothetical protein PLESTB_001014800 [Pleodorina starrii]GLC65438.1 hypothetical protein PLESTF_000293300 [Pleodorina starrii]
MVQSITAQLTSRLCRLVNCRRFCTRGEGLGGLAFLQLLERAETCEDSRRAAVARLCAWAAGLGPRTAAAGPAPSPASRPDVGPPAEAAVAAAPAAAITAPDTAAAAAVAAAAAAAPDATSAARASAAAAALGTRTGVAPCGAGSIAALDRTTLAPEPDPEAAAMGGVNELLRLCARRGAVDDAMQILSALERRGLQPDTDTFRQLHDVFTYFPPPMT